MIGLLSVMHYFHSHGSVAYTLLFLLATIARGQTTTRLPAPPSYSDGIFTSPITFNTQILDQGTELNITWTTTYESVNLYVIFGGDYAHSKPLTVGTTDTFFTWTVDDSGNNSLPFSFRAVNATGTAKQQAGGGFYTGQFWIRDDSTNNLVAVDSTTPTTSPSSATPTTTTTSQMSSSASATTSRSTVSTTVSASSTEITSPVPLQSFSSISSELPSITSTISGSTTSSSETSTSEASASKASTATTSPAQTQNPSPGPSTGAIAGIVIGAVAILAIIIGVSLYFRRQRRPTTVSRHLDIMDMQMAQRGQSGTNNSGYTLRDPSWDSSRKGPAELQEDELVELPNYRSSRQHELP